jgi:sodium/potassium/calcium exchanger 6
LEAERVASMRAGDALNSFVGDSGAKSVGGEIPDVVKSGTYDFRNPSMSGGGDDARTHVSAPYRLEDNNPSVIGNRALNAVLTALSNYNEDENMDENDMDSTRRNGWGIESTVEGSKSWDRPVVLHGADGILTKHHHHHRQHADGENEDQFHSPYSVMEDMDVVDRMCLQDGSLGLPAYNWSGAFQDFKHELMVHFRECWRDILDDEESNRLEKFLLVCEYPMTVLRKVCCVVVYFVLMHLFCVNTDQSQ